MPSLNSNNKLSIISIAITMESFVTEVRNNPTSVAIGIGAVVAIALAGKVWSFLKRSGVFMPITFVERTTPENIKVVAKSYKTSFNNIPKIYEEMFSIFEKQLFTAGVNKDEFYKNITLVGMYFDNPKNVGENNTRFAIGLAVDTTGVAASKTEKVLLDNGYQVTTVPKQKSFMALCPNVGFFSIMVGIRKVYPAAEEYELKKYGSKVVKLVYEFTHTDANEFHFVLDEPTDNLKSLIKGL